MTSPTLESGVSEQDNVNFPPGTILLEDASISTNHGDGHLVYSPTPSDDPNDPLNWTTRRKYMNFAIISFYTFMIFVILDVGVVCWDLWVEEFGVSYSDLTNSYAANLAGLAAGCVISIPFALKYGRRSVYIASVLISFLSAVWMAEAKGLGDLMGSNIVSGLAGAASEALVQMSVADMFFVHQRGTFTGIYLVWVLAGAYLGPVASGFIVNDQGWRWLFWWCAIFLGISVILVVFFYEDTKFQSVVTGQQHSTPSSGSKLDKDSAQELNSKQSLTQTRSVDARPRDIPLKNYRERMVMFTTTPGSRMDFIRHLFQPFEMLFMFPAVTYAALQWGSGLAWFSVIGTTQPVFFYAEPYNFSPIGVGLLSLPAFIGSILGAIFGGPISDWSIIFFARRNKGIYEPEMRLYLSCVPILLGPAGIWLYGYSAVAGLPWIVPCIGIAIFSFAFSANSDTCLTYLLDSYQQIIGDSLVAVAFVRNSLSMVLLFSLTPWVAAIGYRNTFLCAGFLCLACNLTVIPMIIWGKKIRVKTARNYAAMAKKQFNAKVI